MKDAVTMLLVHARVNVETRVADLGDLLGQQLDSLCRVAEDDRLVDLQLTAHTVTHTMPLIHHTVAALQPHQINVHINNVSNVNYFLSCG